MPFRDHTMRITNVTSDFRTISKRKRLGRITQRHLPKCQQMFYGVPGYGVGNVVSSGFRNGKKKRIKKKEQPRIDRRPRDRSNKSDYKKQQKKSQKQ